MALVYIPRQHRLPSAHQGYAQHPSRSAYPQLWNGLVGAWAAGLGPTGGQLIDRSPYKNHGTLQNTTLATVWARGRTSYEIDLDGTDDYIQAPPAIDLGTTDWTFIVRTMPQSFATEGTGDPTVLAQQDGTGTGRTLLGFDAAPVAGVMQSFLGGAPAKLSGFTATVDTWVHIAMIHRNAANTLTWVIDGVEYNTNTGVAAESADGDFIFGAQKVVTRNYDGRISTILLYNRALTVSETRFHFLTENAPFRLRNFVAPQLGAATAVSVLDEGMLVGGMQPLAGGLTA